MRCSLIGFKDSSAAFKPIHASIFSTSKPTSLLSPTWIKGRRINKGSLSIMTKAFSAVMFSGFTSPDFTLGAALLNHSLTGRSPKNDRNFSTVQGSVNRLYATTS